MLVKTMQEGNDSTEITVHAPAATSTNTAIAHNLLHQWLTYFTQRMYVSAIQDFSFESITILHEDPARGTFLVEAAFSVLPKDDPHDSTWYDSESGAWINGNWIRGKVYRFQIIRRGDICSLDVLD